MTVALCIAYTVVTLTSAPNVHVKRILNAGHHSHWVSLYSVPMFCTVLWFGFIINIIIIIVIIIIIIIIIITIIIIIFWRWQRLQEQFGLHFRESSLKKKKMPGYKNILITMHKMKQNYLLSKILLGSFHIRRERSKDKWLNRCSRKPKKSLVN